MPIRSGATNGTRSSRARFFVTRFAQSKRWRRFSIARMRRSRAGTRLPSSRRSSRWPAPMRTRAPDGGMMTRTAIGAAGFSGFLRMKCHSARLRSRVPLDRPIGQRQPQSAAARDHRSAEGGARLLGDRCDRIARRRSTSRPRRKHDRVARRILERRGSRWHSRSYERVRPAAHRPAQGRPHLTQHPCRVDGTNHAGNGAIALRFISTDAPGDPPVPWIVSNPIYVQPPGWVGRPSGNRAPRADGSTRNPGRAVARREGRRLDSRASRSRIHRTGPVAFTLRRSPRGERAANTRRWASRSARACVNAHRLAFRAHASQPMRFPCRHGVRNPASDGSDRSTSTPTARDESSFRSANCAPSAAQRRLRSGLVDTVLFVVDTDEHAARDGREVTIDDLGVGRSGGNVESG